MLYDALHAGNRGQGSAEAFNGSIAIYVKHILAVASTSGYNFMYAPRSFMYVVDILAKEARQ